MKDYSGITLDSMRPYYVGYGTDNGGITLCFHLDDYKFKELSKNRVFNDEDVKYGLLLVDFQKGIIDYKYAFNFFIKPVFYENELNDKMKFENLLVEQGSDEEKELCEALIDIADKGVRANFKKYLEEAKKGEDLSTVLHFGFSEEDIKNLAILHRDGQRPIRNKIEDLLTDCNFHTECADIQNGNYDKYINYNKPQPTTVEPVKTEPIEEKPTGKSVKDVILDYENNIYWLEKQKQFYNENNGKYKPKLSIDDGCTIELSYTDLEMLQSNYKELHKALKQMFPKEYNEIHQKDVVEQNNDEDELDR